MRTLVISDLHLGANARNDVLRRAELREVPVRIAAAHAAPLLAEAGEALGEHGEIVMLAGNHDHPLLSRWHDARRMQDPPRPMRLQERFAPRTAGAVAAELANHTGPASLTFAYPGFHVRDDVYATHGHYLDLHTTVPTIERIAAGAMARFIAPIPERAVPDDYEATLAPLYAWAFVIAQRATDQVSGAGRRGSQGAYRALTSGGNPLRRAVMRSGFYAAVQAINAAGVGPVAPTLSPASLRRGSLTGMGQVVQRLGVEADHVVFGHSHRHGPMPADDPAEWTAPTGAKLHNTGSWVYQPHFLGPDPARSPYRPGTAVLVEETGPPRLLQVLEASDHATLAPDAAPPRDTALPDPDAPAG